MTLLLQLPFDTCDDRVLQAFSGGSVKISRLKRSNYSMLSSFLYVTPP